jgi:hypothetical protein
MKGNKFARFTPVLAVLLFALVTAAIPTPRGSGSAEKDVYPNDAKAVYSEDDEEYELTAKRDLLCLLIAYPEHIAGFERTDDGMILVVMKSGSKIVYDDKKLKSYEEKLSAADIRDSMEQDYPLEHIESIPNKNTDPGRIRCYELLNEVYGSTRKSIKGNLVSVAAGREKLAFNKNNEAAKALEDAFTDVSGLIGANKDIRNFVFPTNGTYNYRVIAGTDRLSPHAFGIAIDLKSDPCDYWRWATDEQGQKRLKEYPKELVRIFEEHGFIWGGKWNRFDFLHYEYRPELIIKAKASAGPVNRDADLWYYGFPDDAATLECIETVGWIFD